MLGVLSGTCTYLWVCAGGVDGNVCAGGVEGDVCIPMGVHWGVQGCVHSSGCVLGVLRVMCA